MTLATLFQDVEDCFRRPSGLTLKETEESFVVQALVAGVKPKDIQITSEKGSLRIEAQSPDYSYSYLVPLPRGQMDEAATPEATAEDGVLKIVLPKAKVSRPLKITVKGA
jgi:HSP20 family molecular chaperone IbpA